MIESEVFELLKNMILEIQQKKQKVVRVGINGIEGTGKTGVSLKNWTQF